MRLSAPACLLSLPLLLATAARAQDNAQPPADVVAAPTSTPAPRNEAAVPGFTRRDADSVLLTLPAGGGTPARPLVLHGFDFNGEPVSTDKLHLKLLSPGVYELTSLAYTVGYWRFSVTDSAGYYGLGEHFNTLDHAHEIVRNVSQDNAAAKGSGCYKCIPFYMSTSGYGMWTDTSGEITFDFNASDREEVTVSLASNRLRVLLFTGAPAAPGRFRSILSQFAALAGPVTVPPYWAFAPWQARDFHRSEAEVREDIDRTRALGLPASVILIDSPWASAYNSYQLNPKQFDDAPGMIKYLHQQGFKLVLWHTSWINDHSNPPKEDGFTGKLDEKSPNYDEAAEGGYFVRTRDGKPWRGEWWKGHGSLIDFTNPHAKAWWQGQVGKAVAAGADGFKDDDAEGNFQSSGANGEPVFADGTDPRLMRNRYGTLYNNAMEEVIQRDLHGNGVLFARSVTTGANGIGFLWSGDNAASFSPENGLPTVVTAGLSAGLSAMPLWGSDLGGYLAEPDTPNALLLQRWTEFSAFSPMMEVMSTKNITPWTFDTNSPAGTTPALDTYRKYSILHMSLFPYRYAAAQQAAAHGEPMMRALMLDFQDDPHVRTVKDEYMFGPSLLVAPVIDENTSRAVYLPAGDWLDLWTGEAFAGGRTVVAKAPADTIPVYARAGTILPKIPEDVMTLVPAADSGNKDIHTLDDRRVYELLGPAAAEPTSLYDFEGRTLTRTGDSLAVRGEKPAHVILRWRFSTPGSATLDGKPLAIAADANGVATAEFEYVGTAVNVRWQ